MSKKQYTFCRLAIIIILSASISVSITLNNYYLPIIFVLSAMLGMYYCRKSLQTRDVLADERDYQVAGKAARYAITVYAFIGAISTFVLMALSQKQGELYNLSQFLAYSVCFLMLLNAFLFRYLSKRGK
jgi:uncharacterized membrane protein